ncbi:ABC transporter permease [candidate division KSB1 bacterium]|nr:ABC transporter permease [candidate division KSB1 bacterium]NIR73146.1 ABC transporter permease [candidate division KSB1 bacterium]NIS23849.1 ABC transporter permease [candidate division KSB1 bacterium]NIT70770.1 ABC transporter permease [candidate division KSB1 bacterium]NIU24498.1 ABC transporter permease [candidate division KSB1 bacterium]
MQNLKFILIEIQDFFLMSYAALAGVPSAYRYRRETLDQMNYIGMGALLLVLVASLSVGLVLALEWGTRLERFGAKNLMGRIVSLSVIREIGPIVTGLMVAGRTGSKVAAELGTMKVTEQIDALKAFGTDPIKKLVVPRQVATVFMIVPLAIMADFIAVIGGYFMATLFLHTDSTIFWISALNNLEMKDLIIGLVKPLIFGYIIATVSCYFGIHTRGGAEGVGRSATRAVMYSSLSVLVCDFLVSKFIIAIL